MKKVLGLILTFAFLFTFVQAFDWAVSSPPASAINPDPVGPVPPPPNPCSVEVCIGGAGAAKRAEDPPPSPTPPPNCVGQEGCGNRVEPAPPPPTAPCSNWNGSGNYPVDTGATCTGNISKSDGSGTVPFSCEPLPDGTSAVYVVYKEEMVYPAKQGTIRGFRWPSNSQVLPGYIYQNLFGDGLPYKVTGISGIASFANTNPYRSGILTTNGWVYTTFQANKFYTSPAPSIVGTNYGVTTNVEVFGVSTVGTSLIPSYTCQYPVKVSPNTQLYSVICFTSYDSFLYQAQSKAAIQSGGSERARRLGLKAGTVADLNNPNNYGVNMGNHLQCLNDVFDTFEQYPLDSPENGGYGYYRLQINLKAVTCNVTGYPRWTGNTSADKISCGGQAPYNNYKYYAAYSCNGFAQYTYANLPANIDFSISACVAFNCDITGTVTISGTNGDLQVMRNGENLKVTYPNISVTADPATARWEAGTGWTDVTYGATGVVGGSSPYRGTQGTSAVNDSKQYFGLRSESNRSVSFLQATSGPVNSSSNNPSSAWQVQTVNGVPNIDFLNGNVNYNWASAKGKTWQMFRTFRVNGEFWVPVADDTTGNTTMQWQKEAKYCGNEKSGKITVVRSVNEIK